MSRPDLNLLYTLDVLLTEGSVAGAARRLKLSPSAMSRSLARLRRTLGDPLLVRAGRSLVPTPRAIELRENISRVASEAEATLRPAERPDLSRVERTITLRCSQGFVENFGPRLIEQAASAAPGIRLYFIEKAADDSRSLRDGTVDLETGVVSGRLDPELRMRPLFRDKFVGTASPEHKLSRRPVTLSGYLSGEHVAVSRSGPVQGLIDDSLRQIGEARNIVATVGGFSTAIALARESKMIATVPERHTSTLRRQMYSFDLPFRTPEITVSLIWHPRMDADPIHKWLRGLIFEVCGEPIRSR